ncbi:MAG: photosystem I reaction center subunit XI [Synechococcales bacterium]|nr:photosystem I reaction center subunit XI [Synechococcales bacterium]
MTSSRERVIPTGASSGPPRSQAVIKPAGRPENGNLATPINSSGFTERFFSILPAYRQGLSPVRRGLEVGLMHGLIVYVPFAKLGPLRDTANANLAGLLSAVGLTVILTTAIYLYGLSNPPKPTALQTAAPNPPAELSKGQGWQQYAQGFLVGSLIGAAIAYLIVNVTGF